MTVNLVAIGFMPGSFRWTRRLKFRPTYVGVVCQYQSDDNCLYRGGGYHPADA